MRVDIFSETVSFHFSRMQFPREIYQFGRNFHQVCQPDSIACKKLKRMESPSTFADDPETDITESERRFPSFSFPLSPAARPRRTPGTALHRHDRFTVCHGLGNFNWRRSPFPAIAPHINRSAGAGCRGMGVHGRCPVSLAAMKIRILGHMPGGKLPLLFSRQAINGFPILERQPLAIGRSVVIGNIHHGMPPFAGRHGAIIPILRSLPSRCLQEFGIILIGNRSICN